MATYFRDLYGVQIQQSEATAARRTVPFQVAVHAAQTVWVSKNGGAFAATAGTVAAQVEGTHYKLVIHATDIDTIGFVVFKLVAGADTHYLQGIQVVEHDPFDFANDIPAAVWTALLATHDGTAGSVAEALRWILQERVGKIRTDSGTNEVKVYDTDGTTVLRTLTYSEAGANITRTPS